MTIAGRWTRLRSVVSVAGLLLIASTFISAQVHKPPKPPNSPRLYIFDCGVIHTTNGDAYSLKKEEMASTEMSIPCILVAHPKGTLMWDNGYIPDRSFPPGGGRATLGVVTQDRPLLPQLAAVGYAPGDITYLSMSHYHGDHVANANSFASIGTASSSHSPLRPDGHNATGPRARIDMQTASAVRRRFPKIAVDDVAR